MNNTISEIDNKIISQLIYLDIVDARDLKKDYDEKNQVTVNELIDYYTSNPQGIKQLEERFRTKDENSADGYNYNEYHQWTQFLKSDVVAKYADWKITNVESDNKKEGSGFVAYTFEPGAGQAVVAFRGSEPMENPHYLNDWQNNASSIYAMETRQQLKAKEYMEKYADHYEQLSITGHSLGGNLALYATITADPNIKGKIVTTDTFNAPGFNKEFLTSHKEELAESTSKIQEFQNKYDAVSSLLYNPTTPIIIDTLFKEKKSLALENHALANLMIDENGMLKRAVPQTKDSFCRLIENFTQGLQMLPNSQLEGFVTTVFAVWEGRISMIDLLKLDYITNGQFTLIVKEIVIVGVMACIVTLKETIKEFKQEQIQKLYQSIESYFYDYLIELGKLYPLSSKRWSIKNFIKYLKVWLMDLRNYGIQGAPPIITTRSM